MSLSGLAYGATRDSWTVLLSGGFGVPPNRVCLGCRHKVGSVASMKQS